jgi:hypothetical protein
VQFQQIIVALSNINGALAIYKFTCQSKAANTLVLQSDQGQEIADRRSKTQNERLMLLDAYSY